MDLFEVFKEILFLIGFPKKGGFTRSKVRTSAGTGMELFRSFV
jgi:hypothetical protein